MRTIPPELLNRVKKKWQVPATDADPKMKVYLSRGFLNELFQVFTIQEGEDLTDVDVTVRRPATTAHPTEAYALAINDGVARVKSKLLPYDDQTPWVDDFGVATGVTSVAIEFDGYWDRDYHTRRFNFVTEDYPWIFYVQAGNLYAQHWQDDPVLLDSNVVSCASLRGWLPANGTASSDQGLIVGYSKEDGKVYYRSYCLLAGGGGKSWDLAQTVDYFGSNVDSFALFRTNDFRVGFIAEVDGELLWAISKRNWSGMSVAAPTVQMQVVEMHAGSVVLSEITTHSYVTPSDTLSEELSFVAGVTNLYEVEPDVVTAFVEEAHVVDADTITVEFKYPVQALNEATLKNSFTVVGTYIVAGQVEADGKTVTYTLGTPLDAMQQAIGVVLAMRPNMLILSITGNRRVFYQGGSVQAIGNVSIEDVTILATVGFSSSSVTLYETSLHSYVVYPSDTCQITVGFSGGSVLLTDTSYTPV